MSYADRKIEALKQLESAIEGDMKNNKSSNPRSMAIAYLNATFGNDIKTSAYDLIEAIIIEIKSATQKDDA